MSFPDVADTFTLASQPPSGGRYIVFCPSDPKGPPSEYDRIQFFCFSYPPCGWDLDPFFETWSLTWSLLTWSLASSTMVDVFLDHRDDLPIFTIVEKRGKFSRIEQVGGTRQVHAFKGLWLSTQSITRAVSHGTLLMLS